MGVMTLVRMRKTLIDYFDVDTSNGSIFVKMSWSPWWGEADPQLLMFEYFYNHSGLKLPSMLVRKWAGDDVMSVARELDLSNILKIKFEQKWTAMWDLLQAVKDTPDATSEEKKEIKYGKFVNKTEERDVDRNYHDDTTFVGSEAHTLSGSDTTTSDSPAQGGRVVTHGISGSYADSDTRTLSKSGTEMVKNSSHTARNVFGFNTVSGTGVPSEVVDSPLESNKSETTFQNRKDTNGGAVTRSYTNYSETDTISGSLTDETQYGKTDTLSFSEDRADKVSGEEDVYEDINSTELNSGKDTVSVSNRSKSFVELFADTVEGFNNRNYFDIVFDDIDSVLTLRVWP